MLTHKSLRFWNWQPVGTALGPTCHNQFPPDLPCFSQDPCRRHNNELITVQPLGGTDWCCDPYRAALTASRLWFIDHRHEQNLIWGRPLLSNPNGQERKRRRGRKKGGETFTLVMKELEVGKEKRSEKFNKFAGPPRVACQRASWIEVVHQPAAGAFLFIFFLFIHLLLCWQIGYSVTRMHKFGWKSSIEGRGRGLWAVKTLIQRWFSAYLPPVKAAAEVRCQDQNE